MTKTQSKRIRRAQTMLANDYAAHLMRKIKEDRRKLYPPRVITGGVSTLYVS